MICTCAAIRRAARRVTRFYDQALAGCGLRVTQFSILATLEREGPVTLSTLADRVGMDRATMGHNLRPLEARGWVALTSGRDRRSRVVALTAGGLAIMHAAIPAWRGAQAAFEGAFGREEAAALRGVMGRVSRLDLKPASRVSPPPPASPA